MSHQRSSPETLTLLERPVLLLLLAGLYPAVFIGGNNWFAYTEGQLRVLVVGTLLAVVAVGLVVDSLCRLALKGLSKADGSSSVSGRSIRRVVCASYAFASVVFLLQRTVFPDAGSLLTSSIAVAVTSLVLIAIARSSLVPITTLLSIMLALASLNWTWSYIQSRESSLSQWNSINRDVNATIEFKSKPNVYAFVLESYQSPQAMSSIYQFENSHFLNALKQRGFKVQREHYSNYGGTMQSLVSAFAMEHHHVTIAVGLLDAYGAREIVGGEEYNAVLEVFAQNGYTSQYVFDSDYAFVKGDVLDYAYPTRTLAKAFAIYQIPVIDAYLARYFKNYAGAVGALDDMVRAQDVGAEISRRIRFAVDSEAPTFTVMKPPGTIHSVFGQSWVDNDKWVVRYPRIIQGANPGLLRLFDLVIALDPEAVIVLFGDHGGWRYRSAWEGPSGFNETLAAEGIPGKLLAHDLFGAFYAIRSPYPDLCPEARPTNVNIFRCLFAALSGDASLLGSLAEEDAFLMSDGRLYRGVRAGSPLAAWESMQDDRDEN